METQLALPHNEAHLWFVQWDEVTPLYIEICYNLLNDDERESAAHFVFEAHRNAFIIAHAFIRVTLSRYAAVAPSAWSFATNNYGRPRVCQPSFGHLDFNLAHSDGIAVCLVGRGIIGVDVEDVFRRAPLDVVNQYFSAIEVESLMQQPIEMRPRRFYEYWTLKESYIKARGLGLSLPLDRFVFDLDSERVPRISFLPPVEDDASRWQFTLLTPTKRHLVAVGLRDQLPDLRIVTREVAPSSLTIVARTWKPQAVAR
jgi:4'-phosphopantetheinyl transferase